MFDKYMNQCLKFLRLNCKEPVETPNNNLVASLMRIMDCFFQPYWDTDAKKVSAEEVEELETVIEPLFIYAIIWSIGCTTNIEGREKFQQCLKELIGKDSEHKFPSGGSVYDY
jgi:dynein heavy chain